MRRCFMSARGTAAIKAALPGVHTKNLFLKDAKDRLWLVTALAETRIDLKALPARIGNAAPGCRSGPEGADGGDVLGVRPGSW